MGRGEARRELDVKVTVARHLHSAWSCAACLDVFSRVYCFNLGQWSSFHGHMFRRIQLLRCAYRSDTASWACVTRQCVLNAVCLTEARNPRTIKVLGYIVDLPESSSNLPSRGQGRRETGTHSIVPLMPTSVPETLQAPPRLRLVPEPTLLVRGRIQAGKSPHRVNHGDESGLLMRSALP